MAYHHTCGTCGGTYDQLKSVARDWRQYCCKDCERKAEKARGLARDTQGLLPRPTVEAVAVQSPTYTTPSGGLGFHWPSVGGPKGAPIVAPRKSCIHDGREVALTLRKGQVKVYGARATSLMAPGAVVTHLDLIIDASGNVTPKNRFVESTGRRYQDLNRYVFPEVIRLHWPDMTAPEHVGIRFWIRLLALLPGHVAISCIGSHGRTGTAMAALLVADGMEAEVAIKTVRDKHCHHAIETAAQADYIRGLAAQLSQE